MIKSWSFSRLSDFEQCPYRAKLKYVDKIPEPERPLRPGQTEQPFERGIRVHDAAELYVQGGIELVPELRTFAEEFERLRELYATGQVALEGEWGFDKDWLPVAWRSSNTWVRMKLDALIHPEPEYAIVVDYKTGRKAGNEVKHQDQMQLYQVATFLRHPELQVVDIELWYLDQDDITTSRYTREQGLRFLRGFHDRGVKITSEVEFPPKPNAFNCRRCSYAQGVCEFATGAARRKPTNPAAGGFVPWD